jgi:hypothetical protein
MRLSFLPPSVAGLGVALCLSSPASAAIIPLSPAPPAFTFSATLESGSFTNYYTFTLAASASLAAQDTVQGFGTFTSGVLELYNGTPTSWTLVGSSVSLTGSPPSGTLKDLVGAGNYYYEVVVSAKGDLVNTLTVSAIPELQTWAMLGIGFAALGFVGFAKGKGERRVFVD